MTVKGSRQGRGDRSVVARLRPTAREGGFQTRPYGTTGSGGSGPLPKWSRSWSMGAWASAAAMRASLMLLLVVHGPPCSPPWPWPCRCICRRGRCSRRCAVRRSRRRGDRGPDNSGRDRRAGRYRAQSGRRPSGPQSGRLCSPGRPGWRRSWPRRLRRCATRALSP